MKYLFYILLSVLSLSAAAQSNKERIALAHAPLLESTVFGTKDSVTPEEFFAKKLHYQHSHGQVQTTEQALHGIVTNKSTYVISTSPYQAETQGDSIIENKPFKAIDKKENGTEFSLDFTVTTVWFEEAGTWKLSGRKATLTN